MPVVPDTGRDEACLSNMARYHLLREREKKGKHGFISNMNKAQLEVSYNFKLKIGWQHPIMARNGNETFPLRNLECREGNDKPNSKLRWAAQA